MLGGSSAEALNPDQFSIGSVFGRGPTQYQLTTFTSLLQLAFPLQIAPASKWLLPPEQNLVTTLQLLSQGTKLHVLYALYIKLHSSILQIKTITHVKSF